MIVARAVGAALAGLGVRTVFGVVGSGNFHVTNALTEHGARFVAARHEGGAATMADAYARLSGETGVLTVHQGPGLTNALTGVTEAAKSRTPLLILAAEADQPRSNFHIGQSALAEAVGAVAVRLESAGTAVADAVRAYRLATGERRTVLLNMPLAVQSQETTWRPGTAVPGGPPGAGPVDGPVDGPADGGTVVARGAVLDGGAAVDGVSAAPEPSAESARALAGSLAGARRPVFIAGRGARRARAEIEALADRAGALLATSAVARGLFNGSPWDLGVGGGFASPLAAELIRGADVVVSFGCALNMWTTRHGALIGPSTTVVQVDTDPAALGAHHRADLTVTGDAAATARAVTALLAESPGRRTPELAARIAGEIAWRDVPYTDTTGGGRIDPRTLSIALDDLLPAERVLAVDSGNFMGYPSMFLSVPDENGFCFTQAFQSVGLGLATAIGAALARPGRLPVAALGDGGALMGIAELETVVRLGLPMVIVIYDDEAYGAEVHHFGPHGHPLDHVRFPPADLAAIARGFGCDAVTVTSAADLTPVTTWLDGPRDRPLLIHGKVTADHPSWWLEEAFRGH
ncbi:thiamine pyrophosphate-binding protein [Sphaerisporangium rubeum]|uniref:Thiamine pyrophosphate-dependent acetolactate synthase large subunit-like protein n=1 Tax=Sphaerisporangium rubeum TaxID=321317 RepID=A0A7X0M8Z1_9ACTN|nr:thiamine pyrophosphate-binding protein [Sphaerisporangium rubeum]MBB6474411.1 thiamine pyrophosphate-dependent acetolactate synthase large subunit-like protein [Sphaerisporangium rubeum]